MDITEMCTLHIAQYPNIIVLIIFLAIKYMHTFSEILLLNVIMLSLRIEELWIPNWKYVQYLHIQDVYLIMVIKYLTKVSVTISINWH